MRIIYRLKTITYGTSSAPLLSAKTIKQLALDEQQNFPLAATMLQRDFYVGDLMTGTDTIEDALILQKAILECVGMKLSKWCSNHPDILAQLPEAMKHEQIWLHRHEQQCLRNILYHYLLLPLIVNSTKIINEKR